MKKLLIFSVCSVLWVGAAVDALAQGAKAQTSSEGISTQDATFIGSTTDASLKEMSMGFEKTITALNQQITEMAQTVAKAVFTSAAVKAKDDNNIPLLATKMTGVATERPNSGFLVQSVNQFLDDINRQTLALHSKVKSATSDSDDNPYKDGILTAYARLYARHVNLFCVPGTKNAPPNCGQGRVAANIAGNQNFVDFLLGERTWPQKTVVDVMALGRAYFGMVPDKNDIPTIRRNPAALVVEQARLAQNNLRMAALNHLAARRAPTTISAVAAMDMLMTDIYPDVPWRTDPVATCSDIEGTVTKMASGMDVQTVRGMLHYVCGFGKPTDDGKGYTSTMSQTAVDRIVQHDIYLAPSFYSSINTPALGGIAANERLEVLLAAQQLTQNYRELQMLKMKTAMMASKIGAR